MENQLKSTKPVPVQFKKTKAKQHWNKVGNSSNLTRKT